MKSLNLSLIAFFLVQSTAYAQSGQGASALYITWPDRDQKSAVRSNGPQSVTGLIRNPNACGVDRAEPVWSSTSALLGYTCSHNENGG